MLPADAIALCIPAYNAASYLPRLLTSAACQTRPFAEILVYDDASSDATSDVARQAGAKVVRGAVNKGCSVGKNVLAEAASAPWLHFHDADDELYPNFVECATAWARRTDAPDVVLFAYDERFDDGRTGPTRRFDGPAAAADPIAYAIATQINPFCGLYRRASFLKAGGYDVDPRVLYNEDVAFHIRLARAGLTFGVEQAVTIINHRRSDSMSTNVRKCVDAQVAVLEKNADGLAPHHRPILATRAWQIAGVAAHVRSWDAARAAVRLATSLTGRAPADAKPLFRVLCQIHPQLALVVRETLLTGAEKLGLRERR